MSINFSITKIHSTKKKKNFKTHQETFVTEVRKRLNEDIVLVTFIALIKVVIKITIGRSGHYIVSFITQIRLNLRVWVVQ